MRTLLKSTGMLAMAMLVVFASQNASHAVVLDSVKDRNLAKNAELIVVGEVVERIYQNSQPVETGEEDAEPSGIPHTFVTLSIEEILKGSVKSPNPEQITLRFMGGMDTSTEEGFLHVGGSPLLDIGDRGVFFIQRNQQHACPLVGWQHGFILIDQDNQVYNGLGSEIRLSSDAMHAGVLHPADMNVPALSETLLNPAREIDAFIAKRMMPGTLQLMRDPSSSANIDPIQFRFSINQLRQAAPFELPAELDGEFARRLLHPRDSNAAKSPLDLLVYRDLNLLLADRNAFSIELLSKVELSEQSSAFLMTERSEMPLEEIVLGNRRVLEDIYPNLITKSLNTTLVEAFYHRVPALLNHSTPMGEIDIVLEDAEFEGEQGAPLPPLPYETGAERVSLTGYLEHMRTLVQSIHSSEELEFLPAVQSADPSVPFQITPSEPSIIVPHDMPAFEGEMSEADLAELQALQENGGNPVLN